MREKEKEKERKRKRIFHTIARVINRFTKLAIAAQTSFSFKYEQLSLQLRMGGWDMGHRYCLVLVS